MPSASSGRSLPQQLEDCYSVKHTARPPGPDADRGLPYLKARFAEAKAWQIAASRTKHFQTLGDPRCAGARTVEGPRLSAALVKPAQTVTWQGRKVTTTLFTIQSSWSA